MESNRKTAPARIIYTSIGILCFALMARLSVSADTPPTTRIAIIGDSIMRTLSHSLKQELAKQPGFSVSSFTYLRPGLSRIDLFDWFGRIKQILAAKKPGIVVIMMGVDDRQAITITTKTNQPGGVDWTENEAGDPVTDIKVLQPDDPEWIMEYARRVGAVMDSMIAAGVQRIFWIELPDMRDAKLQKDSALINAMIQKEAAFRPQVEFQPSKFYLSRTPGVYSRYIYDTNGMPFHVRAKEGVNLNENGAAILAREIVARILATQTNNIP